jgi:hypothetical protein
MRFAVAELDHAPTVFGTLAEDLGTELAVVGVVVLAFGGTLFTGASAGLGELRTVVRIAGHESGVERRDVGHVTAETGTLFHLFAAEALVGTPFTDFGGLVADLDAFALFVAQAVDLGDGL